VSALPVIPAQAGIQEARAARMPAVLDSRLRGNDGREPPEAFP
jgi:hypothetical protein